MAGDSINVSTIVGNLDCPVCLQTLTKPKNLPCGHTFCLECLEGYTKYEIPGDEVVCPLCRHPFEIPTEGLQHLPCNFLIEQMIEDLNVKEPEGDKCETCSKEEARKFCMDCRQDLCESCALIHQRTRATLWHEIVAQEDKKRSPSMPSSRPSYCEVHRGKELELYCNDCETAICLKCSALEHGPHVRSDIQKASEEFKRDILKSVFSFDELVQINMTDLENLELEKGEFLKEIWAAEHAIQEKGESVKRLIDSQVNELIEQIETIKTDKLKVLKTRKDEIEMQILFLTSHQRHVNGLNDKETPCVTVIQTASDQIKRSGEILAAQKKFEDAKPEFLSVKFNESSICGNSMGSTRLLGSLSVKEKHDKVLVLIGMNIDSAVEQKVCHVSLSRSDTVSTINSAPSFFCSEAAACTFADTVFAVGLGESMKELWKYSAKSQWIRLADMESGRRRHCVAVVGSMLYVLGGWDEEETFSSVLSYNISSNSWSTAGQLTHGVYSAACVAYKDSIYVFGGDTGDGVRVDYVQMYNTFSQKCTLMPNAMPGVQKAMRAVLWKTSAVLLHRLTCFIYNFETQTWLEREQYKTGVLHFGAVLNNETLFIAGGGNSGKDQEDNVIWTCSDEVKSVPVMDIISDKPPVWKHHAKLPLPACIGAFSPTPLSIVWKW